MSIKAGIQVKIYLIRDDSSSVKDFSFLVVLANRKIGTFYFRGGGCNMYRRKQLWLSG